MAEKKVPLRLCLGCREMKPKSELLRIVRSPEGTVSLDSTGKAQGRGAYICRSGECLKRAAKSRAAERALGKQLPPELTEALAREADVK